MFTVPETGGIHCPACGCGTASKSSGRQPKLVFLRPVGFFQCPRAHDQNFSREIHAYCRFAVGAVKQLVKATACQLWMHERDYSQFKNPVNAFFYPIANCTFTEVSFCEDGEAIQAGGLTFTVLETPGHTWGSVCFLCEDALFSGDTLFAGSCGRTDLPGGESQVLRQSLEYLSELETDYRVFPGHGESTTLLHEKQTNPYLRGTL